MLIVTRTGANLASSVTVDYAVTGGTATSASDFTLADGTLTFNAGQTSASIAISALNDIVFDSNQTVIVTLSNPTSGATIGSPSSTTVTIHDTTRPAQVRFLNNLVLCSTPACPSPSAFTARLRAEENYTWLSASGTPSAYQNVTSSTLSNFTVEAVGFSGTLTFAGSFTITPSQKYLLVLTVDSSNNPILGEVDEGAVSATSTSSPLADRPRVLSTTSPGPPGIRFAPLGGAPAPTD